MMGEGFGINPTEGEVVSPIEGKVDNVFPTKHAIGLKADNGLEILVHIGLDTVQLDGQGFEILVSSGDTVQVGDPLLKFDLEYIRNNAKDVISPLLLQIQIKLNQFTSMMLKQSLKVKLKLLM